MSSWFYKLRRRKRCGGGGATAGVVEPPVAPAPSPCSPNRASYYVPSRERALPPPPPPRPATGDNPKLRDTHFPRGSPQPASDDIVFDVVVARRGDRRSNPVPAAAAELRLRPILLHWTGRPQIRGLARPVTLAAHRNSILFRMSVPFEDSEWWTDVPYFPIDYMVYSCSSSSSPPSLTLLPPCFDGGVIHPLLDKLIQPYRCEQQRIMLGGDFIAPREPTSAVHSRARQKRH